jgi:hypothetical protein
MTNVPISQLPPTLSLNGTTDYLEISQYVGPPVNYASRKILAKTVNSPAAFLTAGTFTLVANATSTIVPVTGCSATSIMSCPCPLTASAAASMASTEYTMQSNQFTVTHANNTKTDRTFMYVLFY